MPPGGLVANGLIGPSDRHIHLDAMDRTARDIAPGAGGERSAVDG